jgi:hypothetical protein
MEIPGEMVQLRLHSSIAAVQRPAADEHVFSQDVTFVRNCRLNSPHG